MLKPLTSKEQIDKASNYFEPAFANHSTFIPKNKTEKSSLTAHVIHENGKNVE